MVNASQLTNPLMSYTALGEENRLSLTADWWCDRGRQSFSLHLMCEWEHGHFLHERYGYPIFKPRETLADLRPCIKSC